MLPDSPQSVTRRPQQVTLLTLLLVLLLVPFTGAAPAAAEPIDKPQPGLLSRTDAARALANMKLDRNGADAGYDRSKFYKSWRVVTAQPGNSQIMRWYGWDAYTTSRWKEPEVTKALAPQKGCDAREITLIRDAVNGKVRWNSSTCAVTSGTWYEAYSGRTTTDPSSLDIEHIVAMQDAWNNGASSWSADRRLQFAHDPLVLAAVSSSENRSKGSRGPAQWKPSNRDAWPAYAQRYISIKANYDLTLSSEAERRELRTMLGVSQPTPPKPPAPSSPFQDVRPGQEHYTAMVWMKKAGISTGWSDGTYRPLQPVNRDAMAAFLYRMAGSPAVKLPARSPFRDVRPGQEHYTAIIWAQQKGITTGWPDGTFRPTQPIARDAMAAFLHRYAGSPNVSLPSRPPFNDVRPGQEHYSAMVWMKSAGISTGWSDGTYRPLEPVKRDAMAAFLYRYDQKF